MVSLVSILAAAVVVAVLRMSNTISTKSAANQKAKEVLFRSLSQIAPVVHSAIGVDEDGSDGQMLTVVLPERDSSNGKILLPIREGDSCSFYLSDTSGNPDAEGTILWRSINGVPDTKWSLRSGKGAIDLGTTDLAFTYGPSMDDPDNIGITIGTDQSSGSVKMRRHQDIYLTMRNHVSAGKDDDDDDEEADDETQS